jgi:hypothetical protein
LPEGYSQPLSRSDDHMKLEAMALGAAPRRSAQAVLLAVALGLNLLVIRAQGGVRGWSRSVS